MYVHKENRSRRVHVPSLCPKYLLREATPGLSAKEARQSAIRVGEYKTNQYHFFLRSATQHFCFGDLQMEIARRMNCNVDRHELELFFDPELQVQLDSPHTTIPCPTTG